MASDPKFTDIFGPALLIIQTFAVLFVLPILARFFRCMLGLNDYD